MQIFVRTLEGESLRFYMRASDTVETLSRMFFVKTNIPMDSHRFVYGGHELVLDQTLADAKVEKDATITFLLRLVGGAPKKRQKTESSASAGFSFEEFINMGKPQILATDPLAVANALNIGSMTRKHFIFWLSTLTVTDLEGLQETFQESARTGNLRQMSTMILPYVQESKDIKFLEGRIQIAKSYMLAAMMQGVRDAQLSYSLILKMIQKALKHKFSSGSRAASSVGSDEDDMDP
jgi:hypothetical protein